MSCDEFVERNMLRYPEADEEVLKFIWWFRGGESEICDSMIQHFNGIKSYYFSKILNDHFNEGKIILLVTDAKFVWVDENNVAYNIENGVEAFGPHNYIEDIINLKDEPLESLKKLDGFEFVIDEITRQ